MTEPDWHEMEFIAWLIVIGCVIGVILAAWCGRM